MELVVNPQFNFLKQSVEHIPHVFDNIQGIIQNHRNDIRTYTTDNGKFVIKSFKGMYLPNQIGYSLFRKSKAERSYETSFRLLMKGFDVPTPVAFLDCFRYGLLTQSYFISEYREHTSFNDLLKDEKRRDELLRSFAQFTYKLHQAGVYHDDFSNGNILCNEVNGALTFSLVDLNRVRFKKVGFLLGIENLSKLYLSDDVLRQLVKEYTALYNRNADEALAYILKSKKQRDMFTRWRKQAKSIFLPWRAKK